MRETGHKLTTSANASSLEASYGALLDALPDAVVLTDSEGEIVLANSRARELFGGTDGELLGQPVEKLLPERLRQYSIKAGKNHSLPSPLQSRGDVFGLRKDGSEFPAEFSFSPWQSEAGAFSIGVIRDLTARKHLEEELKKKDTALEAASQELQAFSYSVSHDLRAPLRAMDGFASMLKKTLGPDAPEPAGHALQRIHDNVKKMSRLIEGLLDYSSLTWIALTEKSVNTGELARSVFNELTLSAPDRRVDCQIGKLPNCTADLALLRRVFAHLFSNALKFTRDRNPAVIRIGCQEENGERVYFVRDNGAGFDMEYADKLFRVFQRLHSPSEFEGTGVGLAIVQRIVQRHGGRVWAQAQVDQGATFYFTLGESSHGNSAKRIDR